MVDEAGDELLVPYVPGSKGPSPGTLIPANLASAAQAALHRLQHQVGDIDTFVRQRLGYASNEEMFTRLYAEQIDSAAFAFWQRDQGKAFLNADQTGNGKGRWCGTQVLDAIRQGQTAVWITQQADLYAAALSDLADLGATNLRVFATNTGLKLTLPDGTQLKSLPAAKQEAEMKRILAGEAKYDLIFSTYSQLQTVNKKEPFRREFFKQLAPSATFIFDEAHQAGGQTGERCSNDKTRSLLVRELVDKAAGVVFATATAVKDPDILDLYARRTDAIDVVPIHTLQNALHDGGIPLQQMVTAKFAEAGQMLRRERSYDGVKLNLQTLAVDREAADQFCACLGAISRFEIVKDAVVERMREQLKEQAKAILGDGATGDIGARSTNFTSLIHNIVSQSLLGMKADAITDIAIGAKAQEQKPVIACVSTMESHLTRYSEENNIREGDPVDLTYADLLRHNLERSREVRTKNYQGECEVRPLTDAELGAGGVTAYKEAMTLINSVDLSAIPMSFIDYSQWKLEAAGMTVGEITGRKTGLDYRNDPPTYSIRDSSDSTPQAKVDTVAGFNNGRLDALVINSAGFTGISIQASERYADQAQRHLIVGQIHTDINQVMQMFGRVNRFGQVNAPEITIAFSDLPAERRIAALLADRMARLNANTTANRDSSLSCVTASQFFSPYGEEAIEAILKEYPEYNYKLAYPRDASGEGELTLISRVTGRMPLMSVADQEKLYQLIDTEVAALIEVDKLTGHNPLAADQLDLDARTIARVELIPPVKAGNVFGGAVYAEVLDVKRPVQPMTQLEVVNTVRAQLQLPPVQRVEDHDFQQVERTAKAEAEQQQQDIKTITKTVQAELEATLTDKDLKSALERLTRYSSHLLNSVETFPPGITVEVELPTGHTTYGVVGRIVQGSEKGNPLALSNWRAEIYTQDFARMFPVRMSAFNTGGMARRLDITPASITKLGEDIYTAFDSRQGGLREERTVLRGNLLAAYEKYQFSDFAYYTTQAGERLAGMIMPRGFDLQEELQKIPVVFRTAELVKQFLNEWTAKQGEVVSDSGGTLKASAQTPEGLTLSAQYVGGSKFYRNEKLIEIIGEDFYSVSDQMRAEVSAERVDSVLNYLVNTSEMQLYAASHIEIAREQLGQRVPELEWLEAESTAVDSQPIQLKLNVLNLIGSRDSAPIRELYLAETLIPYQGQSASFIEGVIKGFAGEINRNVGSLTPDADFQAGYILGMRDHLAQQQGISPEDVQRWQVEVNQDWTHPLSTPASYRLIPVEATPSLQPETVLVTAEKIATPTHSLDPQREITQMNGAMASESIVTPLGTLTLEVFEDADEYLRLEFTGATANWVDYPSNIRIDYIFGAEVLEMEGISSISDYAAFAVQQVHLEFVQRLDQEATRIAPDLKRWLKQSEKAVDVTEFLKCYPERERIGLTPEFMELAIRTVVQQENQDVVPLSSHGLSHGIASSIAIESPVSTPLVLPVQEQLIWDSREQELAAGAEILRIAERLYAYAETVAQILPDETGEFWTVQNLPNSNYVIGCNPINENFWVEGVDHSEMLAQRIAGVIDPDCTCDISQTDIATFQGAEHWLNKIGFESEQSPAQTQALAQDRWLRSLETREESAIESTPEPLVEPLACNIRDATQWNHVRAALVNQHQLPERYVEALHQRGMIDADSAGNFLFLQHRVEADFQRGEVVNAALYDRSGQFQSLTADPDSASGYFWFQQGKGEIAQVVVVESGIEALAFAKSNARPTGSGTVYLVTDQQQTVPLEAISRVVQQGGVVTLAEGVALNQTQTEQLARLLMTGEPARTTQAQSLPVETAPVSPPQPQPVVSSPQPVPPATPSAQPSSSSPVSIQDIREWYRQAADIGRSEQHLNQIAQVGKAFGQGHTLSQQDLQVMARDRATWRQQAETVAQQAQVILAKVGSELHNGIAFEGSKHYSLFATADQLYVLAAERGIPPPSQDKQILPEQLLASGRGILLKAERSGIVPSLTRVNQADAERFEQVSNRVQEQEHQPRTVVDRLSR